MDAYCERVGMGLLAEPLNAVSNVSFLLAAWAAWVLAQRTGNLSAGVRALIALGASVGVGSILWHTYPTMPTLVLDSVPILIFVVWYIWLYARNVVGMRPPFAVAYIHPTPTSSDDYHAWSRSTGVPGSFGSDLCGSLQANFGERPFHALR